MWRSRKGFRGAVSSLFGRSIGGNAERRAEEALALIGGRIDPEPRVPA